MRKIILGLGIILLSFSFVNGQSITDTQINNYQFTSKDSVSVENITVTIENLIKVRGADYRTYLINGLNEIENSSKISSNIRIRAMLRKLVKNITVTVPMTGNNNTIISTGTMLQTGTNFTGNTDSTNISTGNIYTGYQNTGSSDTFVPSVINSIAISKTDQEIVLAKYTIGARYDSLRMTDVYLYNAGTADLSSSLKSVGIYDVNGNKLANGSVIGTGIIYFSLGSNSSFIIPFNSSNSVFIVKASFNDIVFSNSGKTVQLAIGTRNSNIQTVDGTVNGLRLVSESNGNTSTNVVLENTLSYSHLLVRSYPVVSIDTPATMSTHKFNITANSSNKIILTGITMSVSNPVNGPATFILYKDSEFNGNAIASGSFNNGVLNINFNEGVEIDAGSTKSFYLAVGDMNGTPQINAKRIIRITDLKYIDTLEDGNILIQSISSYSNLGLPSAESTYVY